MLTRGAQIGAEYAKAFEAAVRITQPDFALQYPSMLLAGECKPRRRGLCGPSVVARRPCGMPVAPPSCLFRFCADGYMMQMEMSYRARLVAAYRARQQQ